MNFLVYSILAGRPGIVFCEINSDLVNIIKKIAGDKIIVDIGCGCAGLEKYFDDDKIISIDPYPPDGSPENVVVIDARLFDYNKNMLPVIIRPCHSGFVQNAIDKFIDCNVGEWLYISKPNNLEIDINIDSNEYIITELDMWTGGDGEKIYHFFKYDNINDKRTHFLVDIGSVKIWATKYSNSNMWIRGIVRTPVKKSDKVLDVAFSKFDDLDFSKLYDNKYKECGHGWLEPSGKFWACSYCGHCVAALDIFGLGEAALEKRGYIKIQYGEIVYPYNRLTAEQKNWLNKHGIKFDDLSNL